MKNPPYNFSTNTSGFTILELLIFMALFSVLLVVLTSLFGATMEQQLSTQGISAVETDSSFFLARLQYDMDRATNIILPTTSGEEGTILELEIGGQPYVYSLSDGIANLSTPEGIVRLNSDESIVSSATFRRLGVAGGKPTIKIMIHLRSIAQNRNTYEERTINTTLGLR